MYIDQPTLAPTRKVQAGGIAGLLAVAVIAVVNHWQPGLGDQFGHEISGVAVWAVMLAGSYFTRERA
jgi:hypothetical protein